MENKDEKSLFEIIGFKYKNHLIVLDPVKLTKTEEQGESKGPEDIIRRFNRQGYLGINDAALFAVYFGEPKSSNEQMEWKGLEYGYKITMVMNLISESGISKFTHLW